MVSESKELIGMSLTHRIDAGGFSPHIDSSAYNHVKNIKHLSVNFAVDDSVPANGCLEVVSGSHEMDVPIGSDNCIEPSWVESQTWIPVEIERGRRSDVWVVPRPSKRREP